jgi:WD40 repeat protein
VKAWKTRFSIEGQRIFTGGNSGRVFQYDTESGDLFSDFRVGQSFVSSLDVSNIGDLAIGNSVGDLYLKVLDEEPK